MPQTNKSVSGGGAAGPMVVPEQDESPPPQDIRTAAGDGRADTNEQDDPEIIKSPSDPKKYRYIELSNGLRALLISDFSSSDGTGGSENSEEPREPEEEEGQEEEDSGEGSEEEEENDKEEDQDSDFVEQDEEKATKKTKSSEKQAAAALCIGVGSFSDPDDLPGLAHFLEHSQMLSPLPS